MSTSGKGTVTAKRKKCCFDILANLNVCVCVCYFTGWTDRVKVTDGVEVI